MSIPALAASAPAPRDRPARLHQLAAQMEAAFLSEMLDYAGLDPVGGGFGGGSGEAQFTSFLRDEQARQMVSSGGIGLAESLFRAMSGGPDGRG